MSIPASGASRASLWTAALLAIVLGTGCAGSPEHALPPTPPGPTSGPADLADAPLSSEEIEALFHARLEGARARFTEADVRFMTGMIYHHAQAIEISRLAPLNDADPSIRTLAARIINAQEDEIATMQRWLEDRGQPVPDLPLTEAGAPGHVAHHGHSHTMPGMLTEEQVRKLTGSRGPDFDRLFLTLMIEHHRGAVTMVHELFATDGAAQDEEVFRFASDVQVDQATEVARMERMLQSLRSGDGSS
jgi:uncharacterized protein (DUF305 family)